MNSSCAPRGEERLEKTRQMELQLPELSYVLVPSKCICKEVATKYFLPGDLKLNLFLLGFPNYL